NEMALRTFTYSGGKWTGQVTFCGTDLDVEVQCVGGSWSIKVNNQPVGYSVDGVTNIGGTDYVWFAVSIPSLTAFGIDLENCTEGADLGTGAFNFYLPH